MISDEVKRAISDVIDEKLGSAFFGDEIIRLAEAKLSPKHPPKGAVCEVWDTPNRAMCIYWANGDGRYYGNSAGTLTTFDHYREIPTAQDAMVMLQEWKDAEGCDTTLWAGVQYAIVKLRKYIDNAQEG